MFRGVQAHKRTYLDKYCGAINAINKDDKGFWIVYVNNEWKGLSLEGVCIDTLNIGDSIIKNTESYIIIIKSKDKNFETREYECNKGRHLY
jgi:hypothetical protein